jgi:hypothetical protein
MRKEKSYSDYISMIKDLEIINKQIELMNEAIQLDLYDTEIDFLRKKIIIGDYFSLQYPEFTSTDFIQKTLSYING